MQTLLKIQALRNQINELKSTQPLTNIKGIKTIDTDKADKKVLEQINNLISETWKLTDILSSKTQTLKKGDKIYYFDQKANKISEAKVVSQGK